MGKVTSADGTDIAFERSGDGPPVVVVDGALCDRAANRPLAEELAKRFTVINYDRRGRGDSGDTPPYAHEREIEDLEAIIAEAGGSASVYGHSTGAALALHAAARALPMANLVLHEPPYTLEDGDLKRASREESETIETLLAEGRRGDALREFPTGTGMPPEMSDRMSGDAGTVAMAPTLAYDFALPGYTSGGGTIPEDSRSARPRVGRVFRQLGSRPHYHGGERDRHLRWRREGRVLRGSGRGHALDRSGGAFVVGGRGGQRRYPAYPFKFVAKLFAAWIAMLLRR